MGEGAGARERVRVVSTAFETWAVDVEKYTGETKHLHDCGTSISAGLKLTISGFWQLQTSKETIKTACRFLKHWKLESTRGRKRTPK